MFLAIRDGVVVEQSYDIMSLLTLDQSRHEIIEWNHTLERCDASRGEVQLDPRSEKDKESDIKIKYTKKRLRAYPTVVSQLDMMYWDAVNGTTLWKDLITAIKVEFPKPE